MTSSHTPDAPCPAPPLRRVGRSGLAISAVGLGCNNLGRTGTATADLTGTKAVVHAALDAGVSFFDTADTYGSRPGASEELLGAALRGVRDQVVVATKFGMWRAGMPAEVEPRTSRRYIIRAVEASLRRLETDWIDLYQMHVPDPGTPIEETLRALDDLVRAGKVRYFGHSNQTGWQIAEAHFTGRELRTAGFVSAQNEYNLLARAAEQEVLPAATRFGLGVLPYFPLANGLLSGKYRRDTRPAHTRLVEIKPGLLETAPWDGLEWLAQFAAERGVAMLDVAFGWLLARPVIASVIAGATRPEQVRHNAAAGTAWTPAPADHVELDRVFPRARAVAPF